MPINNNSRIVEKKMRYFFVHTSNYVVALIIFIVFVLSFVFIVIPKYSVVKKNSTAIIKQKQEDLLLLNRVNTQLINQKKILEKNIVSYNQYKQIVGEGMPNINSLEEIYILVNDFFAKKIGISLTSIKINQAGLPGKTVPSTNSEAADVGEVKIEGIEVGDIEVEIKGINGYDKFKELLGELERSPMIINVNKLEYSGKDGVIDARLNFKMHFRLNESGEATSTKQMLIDA